MGTMKKYNEIFDVNLTEAKLGLFDSIIVDKVPREKRRVYGNYKLQPKSFQLTIDRRDKEIFKSLFLEAPDKTVGNGEISLYWLFNYGGSHGRAKETRGGNDPDLLIDNQAVEVKAYPKHETFSLGRFQDRRLFRSLANTLFGVSNLFEAFEGGTGRGEQKFKGELAFRYPDLLDATERFLDFRALLDKNPKLVKGFPIFKQMSTTIAKFEKEVKGLGYKIDFKKPNTIAMALMQHLIEVQLGDKPGDKGYLVNLKPKDPTDIFFHYVNFDNMTTDEKVLTQAGTFNINGGVFKANFSRLFP